MELRRTLPDNRKQNSEGRRLKTEDGGQWAVGSEQWAKGNEQVVVSKKQ